LAASSTAQDRGPAFEPEEYARRLRACREELGRLFLDGLLVSSPENIYYLSGYGTKGVFAYQVLIVPAQGDIVLVTRGIEAGNAAAVMPHSPIKRFVTYTDQESPTALVAQEIRRLDLARARIGCEKRNWFLVVQAFEQLQAELEGAVFTDATAVVEGLRAVKSPAEMNYLRSAAAISETAADAALAVIHEGATENDVAIAVISSLISGGGEYVATWPNIKAGWRTGLAHAAWAGEPLRRGEWLTMEFAGVVRRYHAPVYRTVFLGQPAPPYRRIAETLRRAHDAGVQALRPGNTVGEVDRIQRSVIEGDGYAKLIGHRTGYAVGIGFPPTWAQTNGISFLPGSDIELQAGMVFHMVLYLVEPAIFGMGVGQTVAVTETGHEILTSRTDKGPIYLA